MKTTLENNTLEGKRRCFARVSPSLTRRPHDRGRHAHTANAIRPTPPASAPWRRLTALAVAAALALYAAPAAAATVSQPPPDSSAAQSSDPAPSQEGFGKRLLEDLRALVSKPAHMDSRDWTNLGLASLAVGATATLDPRVRTWAQDHRSTSSDRLATSIRPLGQWGAFVVLGATWLGGKVGHEPSLTSTAEDGLEASIIAAGLITPVVKEVVGRERPSYGAGHASFSPFSGRASFPSGDATLAFSVASVVAAHASSVWLKGTAWGLAGLVGWERIHLDQHWASDVVAGALIGSAVGEWVVHRHEPVPGADVGWVVEPAIGPGTVGLAVGRSW
jgi:membrane-associated phospholipid phosphatase